MAIYKDSDYKDKGGYVSPKQKFYWDYVKDDVKKGKLKSAEDHIPDPIKPLEVDELGPFNDYNEWLETFKENNTPKKVYRIVTRHKEDRQKRMFGYQPRIKYIVPYGKRITTIYGEWDMEKGEGVVYPYGKRTNVFITESIIKKVLDKLNG